RAARKLRRNHSSAQRMHAGEERIAAGGAALLGIIVHEDRAFVADAVDVRRLTDHQAAVVDAWLHPADVVAHDEQDVGLLLLLRRRRRGCGDRGRDHRERTEPEALGDAHGLSPSLWLPEPGRQRTLQWSWCR